jgi:hypothetical protein
MAAPSRVNAEAVGSRETVAAGEVGGGHFRPPASDLRLGPWPSEGMAQGRAGAALTHGGSRHTDDRVAQEHKDTRPRSQGQTEVIGYRLSAISLCSSLPSCRLSSRLLDFSTSRLNTAKASSSRAMWAGSFNQRETPEGCGRGSRRKTCPARSAGRRLPTRSVKGNPRAVGSRRSAASRPSATAICGRTSAISRSRCRAQSAISLADGGRSPFPPRPVAGPGKHLVRLVR